MLLEKASPFKGFFFETKGATPRQSAKPFEFVLVDSPALQQFGESNPDPSAFAEHFPSCNDEGGVCSFSNLGGDARLVSPTPMANIPDTTYSHLAAFVRGAPTPQVIQFWQRAAQEYSTVLNSQTNKPVWFSTSGLGVAWLHMRLDSYPKYYQYQPFAKQQ